MNHMRVLIFLALAFIGQAYAEFLSGIVSAVYDGDTITVQTEVVTKRVILAGGDAPELKQPFGPGSRDALRQSVLNQSVTVDTIKQDRYGKVAGKVLLNGEDANLKQVSAGLAWVCTEYVKYLSQENQLSYRTAEKAANDARIGLWSDLEPVAPWNHRKIK